MKRISKISRLILLITLVAIALYSSFQMGKYFYEGYKSEKLTDDLKEVFYGENKITDKVKPSPITDEERFKELLTINDQIVGWIRIQGTNIDYPVVQARDNDFYLRRNIEKKWAVRGTIFMDFASSKAMDDKNTLIYGHNMKDGTMFGNLSRYKKQEYYEANSFIEYQYPEDHTKWEIFSTYLYKPEDDLIKTQFDDSLEFEKFIEEMKSKSLYDTGVAVNADDKILTLMTCTYEYDDARLVVHGKQIYD